MSPLTIVIIIAIIVLIFFILRYMLIDPYTVQCLQSADTYSSISASSLASNTSGTGSNNFAYSIWFYINDWNYRYGEPKVVFGRMGTLSEISGGSISGISGLDP